MEPVRVGRGEGEAEAAREGAPGVAKAVFEGVDGGVCEEETVRVGEREGVPVCVAERERVLEVLDRRVGVGVFEAVGEAGVEEVGVEPAARA